MGIPNKITQNSGRKNHTEFTNLSQKFDGSPISVLDEIRTKNINRLIISNLNILIFYILIITETKLDDSFPLGQFVGNVYSKPYRIDRTRKGGIVIMFIREDIPSKGTKTPSYA